MKTTTTQKFLTPVLAAGLLLGVTACKTTRQVREDNQSGFLGDYSLLEKGEKGAANYGYIDKNANWAKYTKVWIKPLELWKSDPFTPELRDGLAQLSVPLDPKGIGCIVQQSHKR